MGASSLMRKTLQEFLLPVNRQAKNNIHQFGILYFLLVGHGIIPCLIVAGQEQKGGRCFKPGMAAGSACLPSCSAHGAGEWNGSKLPLHLQIF